MELSDQFVRRHRRTLYILSMRQLILSPRAFESNESQAEVACSFLRLVSLVWFLVFGSVLAFPVYMVGSELLG